MKFNHLKFTLALATFIIAALCGGNGAESDAGLQTGSSPSLDMLQSQVFGEEYKGKSVRRELFESNILVSDREFVFEKHHTGQWISRIDFFYNLNHAIPFSQLGEKIIGYMPAVKEAFYDPNNQTNFGDYIKDILWNLKPVLRNVRPIALEKNGERFLAYQYDWSTMYDFARAVGNLYGSEIIIGQFSESTKLKDSFQLSTAIHNYISQNIKQNWNVNYIEETTFKLPQNSMEADEVVQTIQSLLEVSRKYVSFPKLVKANFYNHFVNTCSSLIDLILQKQNIEYVQRANTYIRAFSEIVMQTKTSFTSAQRDLESVIIPADSRHAFDDQAESLLKFVENQLQQSESDEPELKKLSESLKGVVGELSNLISKPVDNAYEDVTFLSLDSRRELPRQDITVNTWETLKQINAELVKPDSPFVLNTHSNVAKKLHKMFRSVMKLIVNYEQLSKLRASYFKLFEVAMSLLSKSSLKTQPNSQINEAKYYQFPRVEFFSLVDHLSKFHGLLMEIGRVNKRDFEMQNHFLNALQYIQDTIGLVTDSVRIGREFCLESFDSEKYPEIPTNTDSVVIPHSSSNISVDPKIATNHNDLPPVESQSNDKPSQISSNDEKVEETTQNLANEFSNLITVPQNQDDTNQNVVRNPIEQSHVHIHIDDIAEEDDHHLNKSYSSLSDSVSIYDPHSEDSHIEIVAPAQLNQKIRSGIKKRHIVFVENMNCSKCLSDKPLKRLLDKLSFKM